jgi:hypothetical protein
MNQLDYGLLAEFDDAETLVSAARRFTELGFRRVDAHTPFPVEGLAEALGQRRTHIPLVVLIGGILGGSSGYLLQWWASVKAYPLNIGGRPLNSWPAFIPITFELTILVAALFAVAGMLALNGLPQPHHPLFSVDAFRRASSHGYFLSIKADDPQFAERETRQLLEELGAREVWLVPRD